MDKCARASDLLQRSRDLVKRSKLAVQQSKQLRRDADATIRFVRDTRTAKTPSPKRT